MLCYHLGTKGNIYTVRNYIQTRQISVYLCITYGIVIIEIYSCNKELYTYKVARFSLSYCLSMQRLENPKTSVVYHGAPIYICNTLPRDNPKICSHLALPYISFAHFVPQSSLPMLVPCHW